MKVITSNNQIINLDEINLIEVKKVNDYFQFTILKREKFKYREIPVSVKYSSMDVFDPEFSKKFMPIGNDQYVRINRIMLIEQVAVEDTIHTVDLVIHFNSGEPFIMRTQTATYELFLRRLREY